MKVIYYSIIILVFSLNVGRGVAWAQAQDCLSKLKEAEAYYEAGHYDKVPVILGDCPMQKAMRERRKDALRLVTEAYLHQLEWEKADSTCLLLLWEAPGFSLDSLTHSVEMSRLLGTFRRKPVFHVGVNGGVTGTHVRVLESFGVDNTRHKGRYAPQYGYELGYRAGFDLDFPLTDFMELTLGVDFVTRDFEYFDFLVFSAAPSDAELSFVTFRESQYWLDVPLQLRFVMGKRRVRPYFTLGGHANFMLKDELKGVRYDGDFPRYRGFYYYIW